MDNPSALFLRVRDWSLPRRAYPFDGIHRRESSPSQEARRDHPRAPDSLPAMHDYILPLGQSGLDLFQQLSRVTIRLRHAAINDREQEKPDAVFMAILRFMLEVEIFYFTGRQERNDCVYPIPPPTFHLIFKPVSSAGACRYSQPSRPWSINP